MGNKQNNVNRGLLDTERNNINTGYNNFLGGMNPQATRTASNDLRSQIRDTYSNPDAMMAKGMNPNASGWFDIPGMGGGGGSANSSRAGYQKFADTGNAEDYAKAQAGYDEFARTGGVDATALRQRATAIIPSFYDAYKRNAQNRASIQGGYSPGFDEQMAEIGRQQGREGFNASRQVEGDIADKVQAGREWGIGGQSSIANALSGNKLSGLGGLTNLDQFDASLGESRAARQSAQQLQAAQLYQQNRQNAASGLQSLYSSTPGDVGLDYQTYLQGMGGRTAGVGNNIGQRSQIRDYNFWRDTLPGLAGAAGGAVAGMGGGGQSSGGGLTYGGSNGGGSSIVSRYRAPGQFTEAYQ